MTELHVAVTLLAAVAALLICARTAGTLFEAVRLPRVIGEITGGLLLGPTLIAHYCPEAISYIFSNTWLTLAALRVISQVGLVLLMFQTGTCLRSFVGPGERKTVGVLAVIGIAIPFTLGILVCGRLDLADLQGPANSSTAFMLVFATAIAIASIPVISRIMMDLRIMETSFARIVISTAVIDDLVLYVALAVALAIARAPGTAEYGLPALIGLDSGGPWATAYHVLATVGLMVSILLASPYLLRLANRSSLRLLKWDNGVLVKLVFLGGVTAASIFLNLNPMFAALMAGMVVGRNSTQVARAPSKVLNGIGQQFFIPLYFALVGFKLDLIHHFDPRTFAVFLIFACVVKASSIYVGARLAGHEKSSALNLAAALNARGGPGIVLASVALQAQIINESFYAILVLTAVVTSLIAGAWLAAIFGSKANRKVEDISVSVIRVNA